MIPILTPEEMTAVDQAAPEPVEVLIERAGAAVARAALELLGGGYGRHVLVLAGKGNNGADGRSAAARLRRRGAHVTVIEVADAPAQLPPADLVIDAAYGTGFWGSFDAPDVGETPVLAVDVPSGVSGLTGEANGRVLRATRTVTFAALKPGLVLEPGRSLAGEVVLAPIGLDTSAATAWEVEPADVARWVPQRAPDTHKWRAGVLVVAGSPGMSGAARLASSAALRAGAGMVRVGSPGLDDDLARPVEAVGLALPANNWAPAVLEAVPRFRALVVGPGLGTAAAMSAQIRTLLISADIATVVDGDALTILGSQSRAVLGGRHSPTVITPHDGEYERLVGRPPGPDRLAAARTLAASTRAIVLLKGPTTVVADTFGQVRVVSSGDARLATPGTGDVLSGTIGALLARGVEPLEAAAAGAWLHARAAVLGPAEGLVAGDVVDRLPEALAEVRA